MNKIFDIKQIALEKISWIIILINIICFLFILYSWFEVAQFDKTILFYDIGVNILNIILVLFFYKKDILVELFLLNTSLIIQILIIILIFHSNI